MMIAKTIAAPAQPPPLPPPLTGDARLREFGYNIFMRLGTTPAVWARGSRLFTESEAHREITRRIKQLEAPA